MNIKPLLVAAASCGLFATLAGCGTVAGAAGSAIAGSAASGALAKGGNKARFSRQSCDELEKEIAGAQRSMMNPMNIPYARSYAKAAREVAVEKDCEFVETEVVEGTESE
ncbi:hypothetical protein [Henriciella litoralis]|uniref:hypothetical protein n=1 Tax=Henriciella litoralis TaxID=568102 RepID=UPI00111C06D0|nr:hypothetical protein [Henriciella litoralis]